MTISTKRRCLLYSLLAIIILCGGCCNDRNRTELHSIEQTIAVIYTPDESTEEIRYCADIFSSITEGETKQREIYALAPKHPCWQTAYGCVYDFPLEDGQHLIIICRDQTVQSVALQNEPFN